jgi:DNA-binding XRE family transcriptional regulator
MEKVKLKQASKQARMQKGLTQQDMADSISTVVSNYCRKENGAVRIIVSEWERLAHRLGVSIEDIYEEDKNQVFINNDNTGEINYQGANIVHPIPEFLLSTQQKYIQKLEERVAELEMLLSKK